MNGIHIIKEVKKLVGGKSLDLEAGLKLTLTALGDVIFNQHELSEAQKEIKITHTKEINQLREDVLTRMDERDEQVHSNPMMKAGKFIKEKPKITKWLFLIFLLLFNLWLIPGVREALFLILVPVGFPKEWIEFLV